MFSSSSVSNAYPGIFNAPHLIGCNSQHASLLDKDGNSPLHQAVLKLDINVLKKLLMQEEFDLTPLEHRNNTGRTALLEAVNIGSLESVYQLLKAGASPCIKDDTGSNALHYAAHNNRVDILKELLKYNPGYLVNNDYNKDTKTPLDIGVINGFEEIVEILLDYCVSLHMCEEMSRNAMILAVICADPKKINEVDIEKNLKIIQIFLKKGANPSLCDKYGRSLSHLAVMHENEQLLKMLLDAGADWTITNRFGQTPLELANHKRLSELVKIIDDFIEAQKYIIQYKYQ